MLRNRSLERPLDPHLQATLREWSRAIWTVAESLGPTVPLAHDLDHGLRLAQRPVFICGAARSGTTLLRDLLDGHPKLAVVPTESLFYPSLEPGIFGLKPDQHSAYLGRRWLEQLVAPPPYWLLGRSARGEMPYVTFARDFAAWWLVAERQKEARIASWPLVAFVLAYAQWLGGAEVPSRAEMWVEKTPASEWFLRRMWGDFPAAKVIHIVRRPEAVLASVKARRRHRWSHADAAKHVMRRMAPSYWIAASGQSHLPQDRYRLVRYEDLTADPAGTMSGLAKFLAIDLDPALLQPTVAGRPAINNTSFGRSRPDPRKVLDPIERSLLALTLGHPAAKLGYAPLKPSFSTKHGTVGSLAQRERADALAADGVSPHVQPLAPGNRPR